MEEQKQRAQREEIRKMSIEQTAQEESLSSVTEDEDNDAYFEVTKSQSHNGVQKLGTSISIAHDVLKSPGVILFLVWTATSAGDFKTWKMKMLVPNLWLNLQSVEQQLSLVENMLGGSDKFQYKDWK